VALLRFQFGVDYCSNRGQSIKVMVKIEKILYNIVKCTLKLKGIISLQYVPHREHSMCPLKRLTGTHKRT